MVNEDTHALKKEHKLYVFKLTDLAFKINSSPFVGSWFGMSNFGNQTHRLSVKGRTEFKWQGK